MIAAKNVGPVRGGTGPTFFLSPGYGLLGVSFTVIVTDGCHAQYAAAAISSPWLTVSFAMSVCMMPVGAILRPFLRPDHYNAACVAVMNRLGGMMSAERRPVLISVMQYEDDLDRGALAIGDVIATATRFGVAGIEIRPQYWRDRARELPAARDLIARHGLLVTYATTTTLFGADPEDAARLRQDIADAQLLGATQLRVFQGPAPADDDEAGWAGGRALADHAATRGITLALENYSGSPGGTIAEMSRTLERLPTLAVNLDIANYARHGEDVLTAIVRFGDRAISAHVKDQGATAPWTSAPLGGGELHLARIFPALDALPQRLIYCFEFRGEGDPDGRIVQSIAYLRERAWQ